LHDSKTFKKLAEHQTGRNEDIVVKATKTKSQNCDLKNVSSTRAELS